MLKGRMIDHLDSVANQLWHYLIKAANQADVLYIFRAVQNQYESPKESWSPSAFAYVLTRTRSAALKELIKTGEMEGLNAHFVEKLTLFLQDQKGGWQTTSVNTQLMRGLIRVMPDYDAEDDQYLTIPVVKRLVSLLSERTKTPNLVPLPAVNPLASLAQQKKIEIEAEIKAIPKVNIAGLAKQLEAFHNDSTRFKKAPVKAVKSLKDNAKLAGNLTLIDRMLKNKQGTTPAKPAEPARALSSNPTFQQALQTIGLFHHARIAAPRLSATPEGVVHKQ